MYLGLNSVECTVTTYRLDGLGFKCRQGQDTFFLQNRPDPLWSPPILLFNGCRVCLCEVKQPGHEVVHLPLTNAEVWMSGSVPPLLTLRFLNPWLKRSIVESIEDRKIQVTGQLHAPTSLPVWKWPRYPPIRKLERPCSHLDVITHSLHGAECPPSVPILSQLHPTWCHSEDI